MTIDLTVVTLETLYRGLMLGITGLKYLSVYKVVESSSIMNSRYITVKGFIYIYASVLTFF